MDAQTARKISNAKLNENKLLRMREIKANEAQYNRIISEIPGYFDNVIFPAILAAAKEGKRMASQNITPFICDVPNGIFVDENEVWHSIGNKIINKLSNLGFDAKVVKTYHSSGNYVDILFISW